MRAVLLWQQITDSGYFVPNAQGQGYYALPTMDDMEAIYDSPLSEATAESQGQTWIGQMVAVDEATFLEIFSEGKVCVKDIWDRESYTTVKERLGR